MSRGDGLSVMFHVGPDRAMRQACVDRPNIHALSYAHSMLTIDQKLKSVAVRLHIPVPPFALSSTTVPIATIEQRGERTEDNGWGSDGHEFRLFLFVSSFVWRWLNVWGCLHRGLNLDHGLSPSCSTN